MTEMDDERYPIGKFIPQEKYSESDLQKSIEEIESMPPLLAQSIKQLTPKQLDTPYREGGWTLRQVVHHLADSHMNAYIRIKWTITENAPVIKAYDEKAWAETPETKSEPDVSLSLLHALHTKWVILLKSLPPEELSKEFIHPETKRSMRLDKMIALYAWHGRHHLAHINSLKHKKGWK